METLEGLLAGGGGLLLALLAVFVGLRTIGRPAKGKHAGRADRPEDPPPPDRETSDREIGRADQEAETQRDKVGEALDPPKGSGPTGLAGAVNDRRRRR